LQRWHFITRSPFLTRPVPSQFLHFCFFLMFGPFSFAMMLSGRFGNVSYDAIRLALKDTLCKEKQ